MRVRLSRRSDGMSLIELLVVIIVIGILTSVSMKTMTTSIEDLKRVRTTREMETLAKAIVGDPNATSDGVRSSFGYVGDVGAFPPSLSALQTNPGGYSTWNGPYLPPGFQEDSIGYAYDDWGKAYTYTGGLTITSSGNGTPIVKKLADAVTDYTRNQYAGVIQDVNDSLPGAIRKDSVSIKVTVPNGTGGTTTKTYKPDAAGAFTLDSLTVGRRVVQVIFVPQNDTIQRAVAIMPRQRNATPPIYRFTRAYFSASASCGSTLTLRPNGAGASAGLSSSGCGSNYLCVSEVTSDENSSTVWSSSLSYSEDYYALADPGPQSCPITKVTVYCRARQTLLLGTVRPVISVSGTKYTGTRQTLSLSFANYSSSWTTNPKTGAAWTWTDIASLQAGVRLSGALGLVYAYCTQVWVVVSY
jgi:prepilin-type N-terminal cleavage/methylation domain-containing protein